MLPISCSRAFASSLLSSLGDALGREGGVRGRGGSVESAVPVLAHLFGQLGCFQRRWKKNSGKSCGEFLLYQEKCADGSQEQRAALQQHDTRRMRTRC